METTEAQKALMEIQSFINERFKGRNLGFIMTVLCEYKEGCLSATAKTVSDATLKIFLNETLLKLMEKEKAYELPRPKQQHSLRYRAPSRSSKDRTDVN